MIGYTAYKINDVAELRGARGTCPKINGEKKIEKENSKEQNKQGKAEAKRKSSLFTTHQPSEIGAPTVYTP